MLSTRHQKLISLIHAANGQTSEWLISNIKDYAPKRDVSRLSIIACLRILCGRSQSGQVYREKRRSILAHICNQ